MKISKAFIAGMIVLSVMGLTACGTKDNIASTQTTTQSSVASNSKATDNSSGNASADTGSNSEAAANGTSSAAADLSITEDGKSALSEKVTEHDEANAYGFIPETEEPRTSVSVKQFDGVWSDPDNRILSINFWGCDTFSGSFQIENADNSLTNGYVRLEYMINSDGTKKHLYNDGV